MQPSAAGQGDRRRRPGTWALLTYCGYAHYGFTYTRECSIEGGSLGTVTAPVCLPAYLLHRLRIDCGYLLWAVHRRARAVARALLLRAEPRAAPRR